MRIGENGRLWRRCAAVLLPVPVLLGSSCAAPSDTVHTAVAKEITVFRDNVIHFAPEDSARYETSTTWVGDNGRAIFTTIEAPVFEGPVRITARLATKPIPKDVQNVHDKWDRAGNVCLVRDGQPDVELVKFVTAYGGVTEHEVDISHLAPLLAGNCTIRGFVDTWVSPAWTMDLTLTFAAADADGRPDWVQPVVYEQSYTAAAPGDTGLIAEVDVPQGLTRVSLSYLVSGHCTDGRDADEFVTKDNVFSIDGDEVHRARPWRDDCLRFRAVNPYCRRWSDGNWSSDYSRSGWCPGDVVLPTTVELAGRLEGGSHTVRYAIEDVRPRDTSGHFGYWRVSAYLMGWRE